MLDQIKAIVFDAYGTLLDINSLDDYLAVYFGDKANAISTIWRRKQLEYTWLRTLMGRYRPFSEVTIEALDFACTQFNLSLTEDIKNDMKRRYYLLDVYPEVPEVLETLAKKYSLSILSNANLEMLEKAAQHNGIDKHLEQILSADAIKKYKPDPEVYKLTETKLAWKKDQIAFVSSNTWDVAGAKSYGLNVIWLRRANNTQETLGFNSDLSLDKLDHLIG